MGMSEDEFTEGAIDLLERWGLRVGKVPVRSDAKTPDLRGSIHHEIYAIELKQRDSDRILEELRPVLEQNASASYSPLGMSRDTAFQSLIREGVYQLRSESSKTFRLLWVHCEGLDSDTDEIKTHNSLLGTEYVLAKGPRGKAHECHFFGESDFWRYRNDIDGAIVSRQVAWEQINVSLVLNPNSPRRIEFRESTIVRSVPSGILIDVAALEKKGECLIADCEFDRRDTGAVLGYLEKKYSLRLMRVPIHRYGEIVKW